jgi:hypothetical protein
MKTINEKELLKKHIGLILDLSSTVEIIVQENEKLNKILDELTDTSIDTLFSLMGYPKDNTLELTKEQEAEMQITGKYPKGIYCRDWLYDILFDDKIPRNEIINKLIKSAKK